MSNGIDLPKTGITIHPLSEDAANYLRDNDDQFKHVGRIITNWQ